MPVPTVRRVLAAAVFAACLVPAAVASAAVTLPPPDGRFDYQIGGAYPPAPSVQIVDRDRSAAAAPGAYGVCYLNAFQAQTEAAGWWKAHHPSLLLPVVDATWDEPLLDTSTAARRAALAAIVGRWIDGCRASGYQAVEPDNLDSWTRSKGLLTRADNLALAALLIARAHRDGLAIAQKNAPELGSAGRALGFDFAIAEECQVYDECGAYTRAYGAEVFEIEYTDNGGRAGFAKACAARGATISIVLRDRDVVARGRPGSVSDAC